MRLAGPQEDQVATICLENLVTLWTLTVMREILGNLPQSPENVVESILSAETCYC